MELTTSPWRFGASLPRSGGSPVVVTLKHCEDRETVPGSLAAMTGGRTSSECRFCRGGLVWDVVGHNQEHASGNVPCPHRDVEKPELAVSINNRQSAVWMAHPTAGGARCGATREWGPYCIDILATIAKVLFGSKANKPIREPWQPGRERWDICRFCGFLLGAWPGMR